MTTLGMVRNSAIVSVGACALLSGVAHADSVSYGFSRFTANSPVDASSQFSVEVRDHDYLNNNALTGQTSFVFHNIGLIASSITEVYFEDGPLLGIASVNEPTGVKYSQGGHPSDVPGGNSLTPAFVTTENFLATADSGAGGQQAHGVNPGEWVEIIFNLQNGHTYSDILDAIADGFDYTQNGGTRPDLSLRIALHVTSISTTGQSDSFMMSPETVPLPAPLGLAAIGLVGTAVMTRRRRAGAAG